MAELQPSLLKETGALVIETGAPYCLFELSGPPFGKQVKGQRIIIPRDGRKPFIHSYVEPETQAYMDALGWAARAVMKGRPPIMKPTPVALLLHAFVPIPVSWKARDRADALIGAIRPTGKPDDDNYKKSLDALNGIVWEDDSQVVDDHIFKFYSDEPALRVEVRRLVPSQ